MKLFYCLTILIIGYDLGMCVSTLIDILVERKIKKDMRKVYNIDNYR